VAGGIYNTSLGNYSSILGGYCNTMSCYNSGAFGCNITSVADNTFHVNNLSIYNTPTTSSSNTNVLVRNSSNGIVELRTIPTVNGLFSQTGSSSAITATVVESNLINNGVGSLSIPANSFSVGDSFKATLNGHVSSFNNDDLQIRIYADVARTILLADTGLIDMPTTTNKHWRLDINFTVRSIGTSGTASIATGGDFTYVKNSSNALEGKTFSNENNLTFDTTIGNTLSITAQWSSTNASNSIYSDIFILTKTY
jgi:hypothetical protein